MNQIPYSRQAIDEEDIAAVVSVLRGDWLTGGPSVEEFEKNLAGFCGAKHAIAVANGTAALHLALLAAEIGTGDRVITSPLTFLASANCALYTGAAPDFVDIEPISRCISPDEIKKIITPKTKAIIGVDFAGHPCDWQQICHTAKKNNLITIADACHSFGGAIFSAGKMQYIGNIDEVDMTCVSFHPVKNITTGEGGAILTNDDNFAAKLHTLRSHGVERDAKKFRGLGANDSAQQSPFRELGTWHHEMQHLGYNYRLTDIQSALGTSQLQKLSKFTTRKQQIFKFYQEQLADLPEIKTPQTANFVKNPELLSWHLYSVEIDFATIGKTRSQVIAELISAGIGSQVHYIPVHLQPFYRQQFHYQIGDFPNAENYFTRALSIPFFASMNEDDSQRVVAGLKKTVYNLD